MVEAPPTAATAVSRQVAAKKPATRRRSANLNGVPNHRSKSQAASTASPALQKPLHSEVKALLSLITLAATVPAITPTRTANRARRPDKIRMPTAMPDAGQKTATSVGDESSASPNRAARKYATATALAATSVDNHSFASATEDTRSRTVPWVEPAAFNAPPNVPVLAVTVYAFVLTLDVRT